MPYLVLIAPGGVKQNFELKSEKVFLGRSAENHIPLDDHKSSRRHCVVEPLPDGRWQVRDLESLNGTLINGEGLTEHVLEEGDRIEIGETALEFFAGIRAEKMSPAVTEQVRHVSAPTKAMKRRKKRRTGPLTPEAAVREAESIRKLLDVTKRLNSEQKIDSLLGMILDTAIELTRAERGFLILLENGEMKFRVAHTDQGGPIDHPELQISHHIASEVLQSKRTVISADAQTDKRFHRAKSVRDLKLRSVLCTPLLFQKRLVGALYIDNTYRESIFGEMDIELLEAFSAQGAVALNNVKNLAELESKHKELKRSYQTIEVLNHELEDRIARQTEELLSVKEELQESRGQLSLKYDYGNIVGRSTKMQEIFRILDRITDVVVPVVIVGESGTGKELIARSIHFNGPRRDRPFVSENCAAISETLLESELFGYVKGAFTGAQKNKKGLFEIASGGTLFLDEVGDMSPDMQKKILRVLQEGEIRPVGGKSKIRIDVRLLSATNQDLEDLVRRGMFREDLYYRLNVVTIKIPPLRDRREDIQLLIEHFLGLAVTEAGVSNKKIGEKVQNALVAFDWPGNVRELENEIRRMVALAVGDIDEKVLSPHIQASSRARAAAHPLGSTHTLKEVVEEVERKMIMETLTQTKWNKTKAAEILGLSRLGLRKKIERYGLEA
ncbi:MAG: sigma 54-interacting transcriptional regulator [Planctomycetota bacterium]|jgi:transcriptional regulator with GAF, ATPase, and Fis domain